MNKDFKYVLDYYSIHVNFKQNCLYEDRGLIFLNNRGVPLYKGFPTPLDRHPTLIEIILRFTNNNFNLLTVIGFK